MLVINSELLTSREGEQRFDVGKTWQCFPGPIEQLYDSKIPFSGLVL